MDSNRQVLCQQNRFLEHLLCLYKDKDRMLELINNSCNQNLFKIMKVVELMLLEVQVMISQCLLDKVTENTLR